nr:putative insertion sequence ATP-binding protein Y4BM/Y4KI/Y4TA [Bradyrhizobium sp. DOA9]
MITAQLPVAQWHDMIGEPPIADAILDRFIHNSHRIALEGDSMRRKTAARPLTNVENSETNTNRLQQSGNQKPAPPRCPRFSETAVRQLAKPLSRFCEMRSRRRLCG